MILNLIESVSEEFPSYSHTNISCFETDKFFFPLDSGEKIEHSNDWKR